MRRLFIVAAALFTMGSACQEEPCQDYVDYICDCHDGEEGFDCEELRTTLADADQDVQDQCALDLSDQQQEDEANGVDCDAGPADTGDTGDTGR